MTYLIAPVTLNFLLEQGTTLALVDVREQGEYNSAHIPGSSSVPRRMLEGRLPWLVPNKGVQLVLCDDNGQRAGLAAATAARMGYQRVAVLDGGVNRWATDGFATEWGLNVPSKDFGERIEVEHQVPTISADELHRRSQQGEKLVILDTRTPEEYQAWCIPGGRSVPGGELAFRITDIVREAPDATVVINCAGRTRSIIGARVLQRMGLPNVISLRNGTSGWQLAGLQLEHGAERLELPEPSAEGRAAAEAYADRVAREDGVKFLEPAELEAVMARAEQECTYLIDVRTQQEYEAGHIPGFWWFPGGQAVQRADDLVGVRNGTVVFCCDGRVRAATTASWYRQLGFRNVYAVHGGTTAWSSAGRALETGRPRISPEVTSTAKSVTPSELQAALGGASPPRVIFVDTSREFAQGHVPGTRWISRSWLELQVGEVAPDEAAALVVTDTDGHSAALAAVTLTELGYRDVAVLAGGTNAWRQAGLPLEQGLSGVMTPPNDVVAAGPERSYADMINYLRWETDLGHKYER
jgi:rhodanese-related sulfurtransferase